MDSQSNTFFSLYPLEPGRELASSPPPIPPTSPSQPASTSGLDTPTTISDAVSGGADDELDEELPGLVTRPTSPLFDFSRPDISLMHTPNYSGDNSPLSRARSIWVSPETFRLGAREHGVSPTRARTRSPVTAEELLRLEEEQQQLVRAAREVLGGNLTVEYDGDQMPELVDAWADGSSGSPVSHNSPELFEALERVDAELLKRFHTMQLADDAVDGDDRGALCYICQDPLLSKPDSEPRCHSELEVDERAVPPHDPVRAFPCMHLFHGDCLSPWLESKTTCPTCRFDIHPVPVVRTSAFGDPQSIDMWQINTSSEQIPGTSADTALPVLNQQPVLSSQSPAARLHHRDLTAGFPFVEGRGLGDLAAPLAEPSSRDDGATNEMPPLVESENVQEFLHPLPDFHHLMERRRLSLPWLYTSRTAGPLRMPRAEREPAHDAVPDVTLASNPLPLFAMQAPHAPPLHPSVALLDPPALLQRRWSAQADMDDVFVTPRRGSVPAVSAATRPTAPKRTFADWLDEREKFLASKARMEPSGVVEQAAEREQ